MPSDPDDKPAAQETTPGGRAGEDPRALDPRQARLARALRDNLKKRKAQQRQRRAAAPDEGAGEGGDDNPDNS